MRRNSSARTGSRSIWRSFSSAAGVNMMLFCFKLNKKSDWNAGTHSLWCQLNHVCWKLLKPDIFCHDVWCLQCNYRPLRRLFLWKELLIDQFYLQCSWSSWSFPRWPTGSSVVQQDGWHTARTFFFPCFFWGICWVCTAFLQMWLLLCFQFSSALLEDAHVAFKSDAIPNISWAVWAQL